MEGMYWMILARTSVGSRCGPSMSIFGWHRNVGALFWFLTLAACWASALFVPYYLKAVDSLWRRKVMGSEVPPPSHLRDMYERNKGMGVPEYRPLS